MPATASEERCNSRVTEAYRQTVTGAPDEQALAAIMARYGATRVGPAIPIPEL
jgi:hypothetical protein